MCQRTSTSRVNLFCLALQMIGAVVGSYTPVDHSAKVQSAGLSVTVPQSATRHFKRADAKAALGRTDLFERRNRTAT